MKLQRKMKREVLRRAWRTMNLQDRQMPSREELRRVAGAPSAGTEWVVRASPVAMILVLLALVGVGYLIGRFV